MRYRPMPGGKLSIGLMFVFLGLIAVFLVAAAVRRGHSGPPPWFLVIWLAALAWNAYWWLFRIAAELVLDADSIDALSPLRTRRVPIRDLTSIRPMKLASNVVVIDIAGQRPIMTIATKGIRAFTDEIGRRRPDLPIELGWQARFAERMPGWSRFKKR